MSKSEQDIYQSLTEGHRVDSDAIYEEGPLPKVGVKEEPAYLEPVVGAGDSVYEEPVVDPRYAESNAGDNLYENPAELGPLYEVPVVGGAQERQPPEPPARPSLAQQNAAAQAQAQVFEAEITHEDVSLAAANAERLRQEFISSKQENSKEKYGKVAEIINKLRAGEIDNDAALKSLTELGENVTDKSLNAFLNLIKLIFEKCQGDELKNALDSASNNFAYLAGENEEPLENLMKAAQKITNDSRISEGVRQEMSNSLASDSFGTIAETEEKQPKAKGAKKESQASEGQENKSSFGKKEAIGIFKAGVALGLTIGFPPAGWAMALGFLYATKGWGKEESNDKEAELADFEQRMDQVKAMGQNTKDAVAGVVDEVRADVVAAQDNLLAGAGLEQGQQERASDEVRQQDVGVVREKEVGSQDGAAGDGYLEVEAGDEGYGEEVVADNQAVVDLGGLDGETTLDLDEGLGGGARLEGAKAEVESVLQDARERAEEPLYNLAARGSREGSREDGRQTVV